MPNLKALFFTDPAPLPLGPVVPKGSCARPKLRPDAVVVSASKPSKGVTHPPCDKPPYDYQKDMMRSMDSVAYGGHRPTGKSVLAQHYADTVNAKIGKGAQESPTNEESPFPKNYVELVLKNFAILIAQELNSASWPSEIKRKYAAMAEQVAQLVKHALPAAGNLKRICQMLGVQDMSEIRLTNLELVRNQLVEFNQQKAGRKVFDRPNNNPDFKPQPVPLKSVTFFTDKDCPF